MMMKKNADSKTNGIWIPHTTCMVNSCLGTMLEFCSHYTTQFINMLWHST